MKGRCLCYQSDGEFTKIASTEGGEKGVSGKCRHVPNHSICAISQGNKVLVFVKNYFFKGKSNKFLQNIRLIPNSGNYGNGWMQLSSIPGKRMGRTSKKKKEKKEKSLCCREQLSKLQ